MVDRGFQLRRAGFNRGRPRHLRNFDDTEIFSVISSQRIWFKIRRTFLWHFSDTMSWRVVSFTGLALKLIFWYFLGSGPSSPWQLRALTRAFRRFSLLFHSFILPPKSRGIEDLVFLSWRFDSPWNRAKHFWRGNNIHGNSFRAASVSGDVTFD